MLSGFGRKGVGWGGSWSEDVECYVWEWGIFRRLWDWMMKVYIIKGGYRYGFWLRKNDEMMKSERVYLFGIFRGNSIGIIEKIICSWFECKEEGWNMMGMY